MDEIGTSNRFRVQIGKRPARSARMAAAPSPQRRSLRICHDSVSITGHATPPNSPTGRPCARLAGKQKPPLLWQARRLRFEDLAPLGEGFVLAVTPDTEVSRDECRAHSDRRQATGGAAMKVGEFLRELGHPISYYPKLVPVAGSVNATVLLCQLLYWDGKQHDPDGWIYKTQDELREETGLTRAMQEEARGKLRSRGILEEVKRGVPARLYYRVDIDALERAWEEHVLPQTRMRESRILGSGDVAPENAGKSHPLTITETTSETTQRRDESSDPYQKHFDRIEETKRLAAELKRRRQNRGL